MINQIDFHDGYVDGVLVSGDATRIFLRTVREARFTLTLTGVDALHFEDFKQGNIIFELNFLSLNELEPSFIFELYDYNDELKNRFVLNDWVATAKKRGLQVMEITPSYGCSISALFKGQSLVAGTVLA